VNTFLLSQILAGLAFAFGMASFQFRPRKLVLISIFFCAIFNASHFWVLERYGAGTLIFVNALRFLVAAFWPSQRWMWFFMGLSLVSFALTWVDWVSLLGLAATLIGTVGTFKHTDREVRVYLMWVSGFWVLHNLMVGTPVAMLMEACFLVSNYIGWRRFYGRQ
jgi:hypothetical protein